MTLHKLSEVLDTIVITKATCRNCRRPIDAEMFAVTSELCKRRNLPLGEPKVCTDCLWQAMRRHADEEEHGNG